MATTKLKTFALKLTTIKRLDDFSKKDSINKSALVDRLLNEEMDKKDGKNNAIVALNYTQVPNNSIPKSNNPDKYKI